MTKKNLKLEARIVLEGKQKKEVAKEVGMTPALFSQKLNGNVEFKIGEAERIANCLRLSESDMLDIFFDRCLS